MRTLNLLILALVVISTSGWMSSTTPLTSTPACTDQSASETPGKWKKNDEGGFGSKPALATVVSRLEREAEMVRRAMGQPVGFNAEYYFQMDDQIMTSKKPARQELNVPMFRYYCQNNELKINDEYADEIMVYGNSTWPMSGPNVDEIKVGDKTVRLLGSPIGEIHGYPVFEADPSGSSFTWAVLVTKKGKAPFKYLTRKDVLDHLTKVADQKRPEINKMVEMMIPIRPKEVQEAEKQKDLKTFLQGAKDDAQRQKWTDRFNNDYRTDQQRQDEAKAKQTKYIDKVVNHLASVRAKYSADELMQTAYVKSWLLNYNTDYTDEDFEFGLPKNDRDCRPGIPGACNMGKPLAYVDPAYFNAALPGQTPQYYTVAFMWNRGKEQGFHDKQFEKFRDTFFANFDFDALAGMLGQ